MSQISSSLLFSFWQAKQNVKAWRKILKSARFPSHQIWVVNHHPSLEGIDLERHDTVSEEHPDPRYVAVTSHYIPRSSDSNDELANFRWKQCKLFHVLWGCAQTIVWLVASYRTFYPHTCCACFCFDTSISTGCDTLFVERNSKKCHKHGKSVNPLKETINSDTTWAFIFS